MSDQGLIELAHGVGTVYESPIPLGAYLVGAAATVVASFVIRAFVGTGPLRKPRLLWSGAGWLWTIKVLRVVTLVFLGLALISGLVVGERGFTLTTLLFWVMLVVGTAALSSIVGGVWQLVDPWASIERFYRLEEAPRSTVSPPWWVGPALLYVLFWFELVSGVGFDSFWVVVALVVYSLFSFVARAPLGDDWERVDPLSILFGFAARIAPLRATERGLERKGMLRDLDRDEGMPLALYGSIFVLLASTTLDNVVETIGWSNFIRDSGLDSVPTMLVDSVALLLFTLPFFGTFMGAVAVSHRWIGRDRSLSEVGRLLGWSLVPIGIAYVLAHNAPLILTGLPQLVRALGDPFELGWNLLGMGGFMSDYLPSAKLVWFLEIAIIVGGHIVGVLAAHRAAVRLAGDERSAVKSQYALTALMSLYTIMTLWLLAQPLVV